jgi:dolichol-phosphate mannosyltransferase
MRKPKYSIIISTRNEPESIASVLDDIPKSIKNKSEVLVVDSSVDETPEIARKHGAEVIKEKRKGKGRAMKTGAERSRADTLIFIDGDGTDPPQYMPKLLKRLGRADIVLGCRSFKKFKEDDPKMRLIYKIYAIFSVVPIFKLIGFEVKGDPLAGFRAMKKSVWKKMKIQSNDFMIETEMNLKAMKLGLKIEEVFIPNLKRGGGLGRSKFLSSPRMWTKMFRIVIGYALNKKIYIKSE